MDSATLQGIAVGAAIPLLNFIASLAIVRKALKASQARFMKLVLGGMGIRLFLIALAVPAVLVLLDVNQTAFAAALVGCLIVGLIAEVFLFNRWSRTDRAESPVAPA